MHFSTLFITLSAAAGLSLAAPTSHTDQSTCQRVKSESYKVHIATHSNEPVEPEVLTFSLPDGTHGTCSLIADFPAGNPIIDSGVEDGRSPLPINVVDFHSNEHGVKVGPVLGTFRIPSALPDKKTTKAVKLTIASFPCEWIRLFIPEVVAIGLVDFELNDKSGLFVEYGC